MNNTPAYYLHVISNSNNTLIRKLCDCSVCKYHEYILYIHIIYNIINYYNSAGIRLR